MAAQRIVFSREPASHLSGNLKDGAFKHPFGWRAGFAIIAWSSECRG
jgi:hypothetical protein